MISFFLGVSLTSPLSVEHLQIKTTGQPAPAFERSDSHATGHGSGSGTGIANQVPNKEHVPVEKKLKRCNDKTILLVWKQLTSSSKDFWEWVNPSFEEYDCAQMYDAQRIDLNGDGIKEIKIRGKYGNHCGATGNCSEWIFGLDKRGNKYKLLLQTGGEYFYVQKESTLGYKDIYVTTHESASSSYHMIYTFSGTQYNESRCWFEEGSVNGDHTSVVSCEEIDRQYRDK